jgi:hypothetical protein
MANIFYSPSFPTKVQTSKDADVSGNFSSEFEINIVGDGTAPIVSISLEHLNNSGQIGNVRSIYVDNAVQFEPQLPGKTSENFSIESTRSRQRNYILAGTQQFIPFATSAGDSLVVKMAVVGIGVQVAFRILLFNFFVPPATVNVASQAAGGAVAPYVQTPLGYQQLAVGGAAVGLTVPGGATFCLITAEGAGVRYRDDGVPPTSAIGTPMLAGTFNYLYSGALASIQFIEIAAAAILDILYYR